MKYSTYVKAKNYSMNNVVPAFRKVQNKYALVKSNTFYRYAKQLADCGTHKIIKVCNHCGTSYYCGAYMCKNRFCPVCQKQKSLILFAKVYPEIIKLMKLGFSVNIMTFTIKDTESLKDGLYLLRTAYRNISHNNKIYRHVYSRMFVGGIKSLEVKKGKYSNVWHPHFHALVIKKEFSRDREILNIMWNNELRKLVNTSDNDIYEPKHYTNEKLGDIWIKNLNKENKKSRIKAVYECIKYITKYQVDLDSCLEELVSNLKSIRSVESWGLLRGIEKDAEEQNLSLSDTKNLVCKTCGNDVFNILDGITIEEVEKLGISTDFKDFDTLENSYDNEEI